MHGKLRVIACAALVCAANARAQERTPLIELTPFGGYTFGGEFEEATNAGTLEIDDSASFGLILNIRESANTQWEILYSRQSSEANGINLGGSNAPFDIDVHYIQAGGAYLADRRNAQPFLSATIGAAHFEPGPRGFDGETFFSFSLGAGFRLRPNERLGFRLEARAYGTALSSDTDLFCETGPDSNVCAIRASGSVLWQFESLAGLVFRF